jgi:L-lactate dehydrogenase complex protein LldG
MINRLLPFICKHLALVIEKKKLVATMHQAYQHADAAKNGFGVFIAGPYKTADIEQSLVIGAHGLKNALYLLLIIKIS